MKPPAKLSQPKPAPPDNSPSSAESLSRSLINRHLRLGWWGLLVFLSLGILLEALHGFKIGFYLNVSNSTRRLMWTLAHAHGTLLSLINLAFAFSLPLLTALSGMQRKICSAFLAAALLLLPAGFFLGGLFVYSGDPGLGILLVPAGALLLWIAVFLAARASLKSK